MLKKISILYLISPYIIFCFGYLRWYVALGICAISILSYGACAKGIKREWQMSIVQCLSLTFLSIFISFFLGVGGFWTQSSDWMTKNPVLNDLSMQSWPIVIDPAIMPIEIQQIIGSESVAFVYYIFYFLPAAVVGQIGGLISARAFLLIWTALGMFFVFSLLFHFLRTQVSLSCKHYFLIVLLFFSFGGFDIIGHCLRLYYEWNPEIPLNQQTLYATWRIDEWCRPYFTYYAANWTSLFWCFNQCIPIWIIVLLLLDEFNLQNAGFFYSFSLLYSPWCAMGLIPIVVWGGLHELIYNVSKFKNLFSIQNIIFPLLMLLVVGSFYLSNSTSIMEKGWFWEYLSTRDFFGLYFIFIILEIGIYLYLLRKDIKSNPFLQSAFFMLFVIPFYKMTAWNDWIMRASIPALFIVFIYWVRWCCINWSQFKKLIISVCLLTSFSAVQLFSNSLIDTVNAGHPVTTFEGKSFCNMTDLDIALLGEGQFFAHNYKDTFFWKYLAK